MKSRPKGTLIRKAMRQEKLSAIQPAANGPPNEAQVHTSASTPNTLGTSLAGKSAGISA